MKCKKAILIIVVTAFMTNSCSNMKQIINRGILYDIIFADSNGKQTDTFDPHGMKWYYVDKKKMPSEVRRIYDESIEDAKNGKYEESIKKLMSCITMQSDIPILYYDLAYTYVLFNKPKEALETYEMLDEITPTGYLLTKTYIHMLWKEINGELAPGFTSFYMGIEDMNNTVEKANYLKNLLELSGYYPPLVKEYLKASTVNDYEEIIRKALINDIDSDTKVFLLNYLALRLVSNSVDKSIEIWENIEKAEDSTLLGKKLASMSLDYYSK